MTPSQAAHPPQLVASQYADLEVLAADEPGATVDLAGTPEQIVDEAIREFGSGRTGIEPVAGPRRPG